MPCTLCLLGTFLGPYWSLIDPPHPIPPRPSTPFPPVPTPPHPRPTPSSPPPTPSPPPFCPAPVFPIRSLLSAQSCHKWRLVRASKADLLFARFWGAPGRRQEGSCLDGSSIFTCAAGPQTGSKMEAKIELLGHPSRYYTHLGLPI